MKQELSWMRIPMKQFVMAALMFNLGIASIYSQPLNMKVSGTAGGSTINLGTGTSTGEYDLNGSGTLGQFSLRVVSAAAASPQPSTTCLTRYVPVVAGKGVFRFRDGSLMTVNLTGGSDCIDPAAGQAKCIRIFQVVGGTGRFQDASGAEVTLTMTVAPVVAGEPNFFTVTGTVTGTISGVGEGQGSGGGQP